jgi:hypothetical protein
MHRVAFDPTLPVVAAQPFMAAGRSFVSGETVDWRALGVTEAVLFDWWRAGQVSHPVTAREEPLPGFVAGGTVELKPSKRRRS